MSFWGQSGGIFSILLVCSVLFSPPQAGAQLYSADPSIPNQLLGKKLGTLSKDLDMKEGSYTDSSGGGGKEVNDNDSNSFLSTTTYHSYIWDYCMKWAGGKCNDWLAPYVSIHGLGADKSPLEGVVYSLFSAAKATSLWIMKSQAGNPVKSDGTLDRENMTEWRLNPNAEKKVEKVGIDTANRQMFRTYNANEAKDPEVMPNIEGLRVMAARWTKMFRNRLLSNIGDIRAYQPGIEVAQGEDIPECKDYEREVKKNPSDIRSDDMMKPQNRPDMKTRLNRRIEDRMALCEQVKRMSAYTVTPMVQGTKLQAGTPKREWIDAALSRANLIAVDRVGVDPRTMTEIDPRIQITDKDLKPKIAQYAPGGRKMNWINMSNADQLYHYNRSLQAAAIGYKETAARGGGFIQDKSARVVQHKIGVGTINMVKLNDITPAMRNDLQTTGLAMAQPGRKDPGDNLETMPMQLTRKSLQ